MKTYPLHPDMLITDECSAFQNPAFVSYLFAGFERRKEIDAEREREREKRRAEKNRVFMLSHGVSA